MDIFRRKESRVPQVPKVPQALHENKVPQEFEVPRVSQGPKVSRVLEDQSQAHSKSHSKSPHFVPHSGTSRGKHSNSKSNYTRPNGHDFEGHTHNPLSPFLYHPDMAEFLNREPEERVILMVRKHPITNLKWMLTAIFMLFMPLFFSMFSFFSVLSIDYRLILSIIWYLIVFAFVFEEFLMWFFHVNIITDERIIEVDFINIFHREMTDANIDQVQDVTVELGGGLRTFFNYGNVIVQTAAEVPKITFESVPKPDMVAKILRELRVEEEQEKLEGRVR